MTTVSVVIPTYDSADTLPRAIDSALAQTHDDLEVLVVDDASTDETPAVVESYDDQRVELLGHDRNCGGSAARNTGIEAASGEFVALLDADDEWHPEKVERQVAALEPRSDSWVGAYCGVKRVLPRHVEYLRSITPERLKGSTTNTHYGEEGGEELLRDVLMRVGVFGGSSTLLVRHRVADEMGGFDESFPRHQDLEFLVRLLQRGTLAYVDDVLVRKYPSPSGPPSAETVAEAKALLFSKFADEIRQLEQQGVPVTKNHQHELVRHYCMDGRWRDALGCLVRPDPHLSHDRPIEADDVLDLLWPVVLGVYATVSGQ